MKLGLGLSLPNIAAQGVSLPRRIASILRKFGTDAHLCMPGPGVPVLGPELVVNGSEFLTTTGWSVIGNSTLSVAAGRLAVTGNGSLGWPSGRQTIPVTVGSKYAVSVLVDRGTGSVPAYVGYTSGSGANYTQSGVGVVEFTFIAGASTVVIDLGLNTTTATGTAYFDNISVREILGYTNKIDGFTTGNYLESTGNTDASVDGAVGLVLDAAGSVGSDNLSPSLASSTGWSFTQPTIGSVSISAGTMSIVSSNGTAAAAFPTVAPLVSGKLYKVEFDVTSVSGAGGIFTNSAGGNVLQFTAPGRYSCIYVCDGGGYFTFKMGGVTSFAVRNLVVREITGTHATQATTANKPKLVLVNGKYAWQFDGVDDRLQLSKLPFGINEDHWAIIACACSDFSTERRPFFIRNGIPQIGFTMNNNNSVRASWSDDSGATVALTTSAGTVSNNSNFVLTMRNTSGNRDARLNGVIFGTSSVVLGAATLLDSSALIGSEPSGRFFQGKIYCVMFGKGTISDADLKTLEKWIGSLSGVQIP